MTDERIIRYQLAVEDNHSDFVLPPNTSIADAVKQADLDLLDKDRVEVRVYEEGRRRKLASDEAKELEAALEHSLGYKITVHEAS